MPASFDLPSAAQTLLASLPVRARGPMQSRAWQTAAWTTFGGNADLRRFVVDDQAEAVLIRPKQAPFDWYRLPGVAELGEPTDFAYHTLPGLVELARIVVAAGLPLYLGRLPADSPTLAALRDAVGRRGRVVVRPAASYPAIDLDTSWCEPVERLNTGRRSDFRRALKRAREIGEVRSEIVSPNLDDLDRLLDLAFRIEARSWKGESGTALANDATRAAFYRRYAEAACVDGHLRIAMLHIGGAAVAMQLAVVVDDGFWLLKVGYDADYARCSPGNILLAASIEYAARAELRTYEFLGVADSWTRVWTEFERSSVAVRVIPYNVRGAAVAAADLIRAWRRRGKRATP